MAVKSAFVVAGTHSGCGKTTLTLAVTAALAARGFRVQPFKVGPDFIDPGFHAQTTGVESRNLDGWMLSREYNTALFERLFARADVAVVEGVMGLFDGYDGLSEAGSTAEAAKRLGLPVVLVVDAASMARSAAALVFGYSRFDPDLKIAGVIFNRIGGEGHLAYLKEAMGAALPEIPVLGGIPRDELMEIPERHLGLVTADEIFLTPERRAGLAGLVERRIDLDFIIRTTERDSTPPAFPDPGETPPPSRDLVEIAVARDAAYCFYYPDNFELLERAGARLRFFSPLAGEGVPDNAAGVYLGGGYPELFADRIARNTVFMDSLRAVAARGAPVYAECGGLMTLGRFIETLDGNRTPMAGLLPFGTRMLGRRKALGYTEVVLTASCLLGEPGRVLRGHEFHYSEIVEPYDAAGLSCAYELRKRKLTAPRPEGFSAGSVLASYVHLHWGSAPEAADSFVERCRKK